MRSLGYVALCAFVFLGCSSSDGGEPGPGDDAIADSGLVTDASATDTHVDEVSSDTSTDATATDTRVTDGATSDTTSPSDGTPPVDAKPPASGPQLAIYWGQNGYGGAHPAASSQWEKPLDVTCTANPAYDVVVLAFATSFVRTRNADGYPELNFANHCETAYDARNPFLLKCPDIQKGIETCQASGKRVVLSLGGASGAYGFVSDAEGEAFAKTVWEMFLGGKGSVRPFGSAVLDGVDLDLEGGSATGYSAFVKKLRALSAADASRHYLITGAPQCPYPDAYLGPGAGKPLGDALSSFDYLFVQFYNNACAFTGGAAFDDAWKQWAALGATAGGPKIFVGLPATTEAAASSSFVVRSDVAKLLGKVKSSPSFGGVMLWDVSYDQNSTDAGKTYAAYVSSLMR